MATLLRVLVRGSAPAGDSRKPRGSGTTAAAERQNRAATGAGPRRDSTRSGPARQSRAGRLYEKVVSNARHSLVSLLGPKQAGGRRYASGGVGLLRFSNIPRTLGEHFFSLPLEIQLQILNLISLYDLLNLRQTSQGFRQLALDHEHYLVRAYIQGNVPPYISHLYPPPFPKSPDLQYLADVDYKQRASASLAYYLAEQVLKEMLTRRQRRSMDPQLEVRILYRLRRGMTPLILLLFHFFETYMSRKLERLDDADDVISLLDTLSSEKNMQLQSDILSQYPDEELLKVHQMYHLLLHLFIHRMTPPSLPVLGTLGRWKTSRPPNSSFAKILLLGGIGAVWRLYRMKGYRGRRRAFEKYVRRLDAERGSEHSILKRIGSNVAAGVKGGMGKSGPDSASIRRLAQVDVDELIDLWTPAAEERLLAREIVTDLDEVGCCGRFVSLLMMAEEEEEDNAGAADEEGELESDDDYQETSFSMEGTLSGQSTYGFVNDTSADEYTDFTDYEDEV